MMAMQNLAVGQCSRDEQNPEFKIEIRVVKEPTESRSNQIYNPA